MHVLLWLCSCALAVNCAVGACDQCSNFLKSCKLSFLMQIFSREDFLDFSCFQSWRNVTQPECSESERSSAFCKECWSFSGIQDVKCNRS